MNTKKDLKKGIFIPSELKIGACITRRIDIVWIETNSSKNEVLKILKQHPQYSQFPVCAGTIDSVIGVLSSCDFFESLCEKNWCGLKNLIKKPVYLPETASIAKTLAVLKQYECEMAFIIDEYGGIEGMVSLTGLINDLLIDIKPLEKINKAIITKRGENSWLVIAQARIEDVLLSIPLPKIENSHTEYYTLAGYVLAITENIPKAGDIINYKNFSFEIILMDGNRIEKILIKDLAKSNL